MAKFIIILTIFLNYSSLLFAMNNKPYHHLSDGTFRNPEGSPERDSMFNWSFKKFNDEKTQVPMSINIDDIKVLSEDGHTPNIKLDDTYTLKMKYPSLTEFIKNNFDNISELNVNDTFDLIASCIDQVYTEEESWSHQECTKKELNDFVESLNSNQFKMVEKFFTTMPKLSHTVKVINPNTKVESEIKIEGLQSFFG